MTSEDFIVPYVFVLKRYKVLPTSLFVLSGTTVGVGGAKKTRVRAFVCASRLLTIL